MKNVPERTCLGCRTKKAKGILLRFTVDGGKLVQDAGRRQRGRGVYCCQDKDCVRLFLRNKKKIAKMLRVQEIEINEGLKGLFGSE